MVGVDMFSVHWQVLAIGMIFIGITMTLIAHWPGSTSIGENPLKIAGPILLSVGLVALFVGIFLVYVLNKRERGRWQKQMANFVISRSYVFRHLSFASSKHETVLCDNNAVIIHHQRSQKT